jgi:hypothetical protein
MPKIIYVGFEIFNKKLLNSFKYLKVPIPKTTDGQLSREIHIVRLLLIDMIDQLTDKDIVVTSEDRKFLYQSFCNTLSYEELLFDEEKYIEYDEIYLCLEGNIENLKNYRENLYPQSELIKKYAPMFLKSNIQGYNFEKEFIILHYRKTLVCDNNKDTIKEDMDFLLKLFKDFNIFIFGKENEIKTYSNYNLITRLKDYVTLMNHEKCLCVVSICSGGGQLTQYFCNSNVLYYNKENDIFITNRKIHFWDQTTISNVNRYYFNDLEELQYYINISENKIHNLQNHYYYVENVRLIFDLGFFAWKWYILYYNLIDNTNTQKLAQDHYIRYGRNENKKLNPILFNFDWIYYLNNNQDLLQNGICNKELAEIHYIKYGHEEQRKCNEIEYIFSNNWFRKSPVNNFNNYLQDFTNQSVKFLEIGCYEGAATVYSLKNFLIHGNSKIHVIDTFEGSMEHNKEESYNLFNRFDHNIKLTSSSHKVIVHKGYSHDILKVLNTNFDFIYIDASHTSYDVLADAILAFPLLKINGIMIFDDYEWRTYQDESLNPKLGIDSFLKCYNNFIEILQINYQVIIKKIK